MSHPTEHSDRALRALNRNQMKESADSHHDSLILGKLGSTEETIQDDSVRTETVCQTPGQVQLEVNLGKASMY